MMAIATAQDQLVARVQEVIPGGVAHTTEDNDRTFQIAREAPKGHER